MAPVRSHNFIRTEVDSIKLAKLQTASVVTLLPAGGHDLGPATPGLVQIENRTDFFFSDLGQRKADTLKQIKTQGSTGKQIWEQADIEVL